MFTNENFILGGDLNLYLNHRLDRLEDSIDRNDNHNFRTDVLSFMDTNDIVDVWRVINPDRRAYTWHKGNKRSRLDYFLISEHLLNSLQKTEILPGIHSDHSLIHLSTNSGQPNKRGMGFWKFNASLLHDKDYVDLIKLTITQSKDQYSYLADKGLIWELIKLDIRARTIPYSVQKKREKNAHERNINDKYHTLHNLINTAQVDEDTINNFNEVKTELENIEQHRARGIILRSKCQWAEEGEKTSSYFLRLEKQRYVNKLITKLQAGDKVITEPKAILNEEKKFYENLYSCDPNSNLSEHSKYFTENDLPILDLDQQTSCEGIFLEKEILKSIKELKNGKSPGSDGLTA